MSLFKGVSLPDGTTTDFLVKDGSNKITDGSHLLLLPGLIDPHVHFRTPGFEHKENWVTAARAAICGGYTTVFDMPNTLPPTITATHLHDKQKLIDAQLAEIGIPLRYQLFFGADKHHLDQISRVKGEVCGIKVFMGCSTGNLVIDDDESLHAVFQAAAANHMLVAVHAEDEELMQERKKQYLPAASHSIHSVIRSPEVALRAVKKAISLCRQYGVRLYILHVSTADEIMLIRQAKQDGLPVFAETTPHHLFLCEDDYAALGGLAVVNPPLRAVAHTTTLWEAIAEGVIDTIGSDHAPHTLSEKQQPYDRCPSGMPGIETTLPLLLTACHEGKISLDHVLRLTCHRPRDIFGVPANDDWVLVDRQTLKTVNNAELSTHCHWSAFAGRKLTGWPFSVSLRGKVFDVSAFSV